MLKNNYHTHVAFCNHAEGFTEDYVKEAIKFNMEELGMSDHAPIMPNLLEVYGEEYKWIFANMDIKDFDNYLKDVHDAKAKYQDKIKIYTGVESEYLPKCVEFLKFLRSKLDYMNLGVHFFYYNGRIYNTHKDINYENLDGYVNACIEGMETGLFNCLVHPDLFMYSYKNEEGKNVFDERCVEATKKICEAAIKLNCYVEVNVNGVYNAKCRHQEKWSYPYKEFWEIARNYKDLKIIIGADCHSPSRLNYENTTEVIEFTKDLGLNILEKMEMIH